MNENNDKLRSKDTRWDRIRKRHLNSITIKTETVKKFLEIDYIGKGQTKMLNGDVSSQAKINPALVMDLRHEMIEKSAKKKRDHIPEKVYYMENVKEHNQAVEDRYIENELNKFKAQLQKSKPKSIPRQKLCIDINNQGIYNSLKKCNEHLSDFYKTSSNANEKINKTFEKKEIMGAINEEGVLHSNRKINPNKDEIIVNNEEISKNNKKIIINNGEITGKNEEITVEHEEISGNDCCIEETDFGKTILNGIHDEANKNIEKDSDENFSNQNEDYTTDDSVNRKSEESREPIVIENKSNSIQERCVRFEDSVAIINYSPEQSEYSNTSEDVDSVISDFVEIVVQEIKEEAEMEMIGHHIETPLDYSYGQDHPGQGPEEIIEHDTVRFSRFNERVPLMESAKIDTILNDEILKITKIEQDPHVKFIVEIHSDNERSSEEVESVSNEQDAIIAELFRPKFQQDEIILKKYFLKWIHFTTIEKLEKENLTNRNDRIHKINAFLDKIRREKNRIPTNRKSGKDGTATANKGPPVVVAKKYQNKIKIQQDIIELQKLKLERQERMIMELKLSKLSEEAKLAKQGIKAELKSVIRNGNVKSRSKAKCLQLVSNLRDEEDDEFARLQGKALLMPKFLARMQERALQRSIKHEQARQRRLQLEAEKEAAKIAAEEAKRLEDEEAKRKRIEALQEKRRQEKMAKIIKERERQHYLENKKKCEEFSRRRLLRQIGLEGFKRLIALKKFNYKKSETFRRNLFRRRMFKAWKEYYYKIWQQRYAQADTFYCKILKRRSLHAWRVYISMERSKFLVAVDWYELRITEKCFNQWVGATKLAKIIEEALTNQALSHYQWHLKWKVLDRWQRLPQIIKLEKETELRRLRWRMKIWELLPDYTPNRDETF